MTDLLTISEKLHCELKEVRCGVPKSIYESISAFANTEGGKIYLGVSENKPYNKIVGVSNPEQYKKDIINTVHNKTKVSYPVIEDGDIEIKNIEGKKIVIVNVNEAPKSIKPVFLNGSLSESFGRSGDGDYLLTKNQIKYLLNDNNEDSYDLLINSKGYSFKDVNIETLHSYRKELNSVFPNNIYIQLSDEQFLINTGLLINSEGKNVLSNAAVILLTDYSKIVSIFPNYLFDYQRNVTGNSKWDNRIVSDEPTWSGNLYDFYQLVFKDLYTDIPSSYVSNNGQNIGKSLMIDCIKEALANAFSNHSFFLSTPLKIIRNSNSLTITNSGRMLVKKERAILGGISIARNQAIITFFRRIGVADRSGTGIPKMYHAMEKNGFPEPIIVENTTPEDSTTVVLNFTANLYSKDSKIENDIVDIVMKHKDTGISIIDIAVELNVSRQYVSSIVNRLIQQNRLIDNGKATRGRLIFINE